MAKVVRGVDDYKKEFLSIFNSLCGRHGRWEVWSDFIQLAAIDISNVTDKGNAPKRAADARNIAKKYSEDEIKRMAEMLMQMVYAIDENPDQDFLGELYMACNLGNDHAGQFFTPYNVCQCMSEITYDVPALLDGKGFIAVNDPACGAGALLLSFANICKPKRWLKSTFGCTTNFLRRCSLPTPAMFGMWPVWVSVSKATAFGMDAISAHRQSTQSTKTALQQPLQAAGYWRDIDG